MPRLDPDATIIVPRGPTASPGPSKRKWPSIRKWRIAAAALGIAILAAGSYVLLRPNAPPSVAALPIPLRDEAEILAEQPQQLIVNRFAPNPHILVLDFPSLMAQGHMFNRVAAFLEKLGEPRDRVLDDPELAEALRRDNSTVETYYYGHDYRTADVARFFATADRQHLQLNAEEQELRRLLTHEGLLTATSDAAVISIPREGSDPFVDASGRASLLRHELSHGEFFTSPAYTAFTRAFWVRDMTQQDRDDFRGFLTRQGYDPANEDSLANETQAHLMNTTDARYFNARDCGIPVARVDSLRVAFLAAMPPGWLHDAAAKSMPKLP